MKLTELARLLNLSPENLVLKAKAFDIDLLSKDDEVAQDVVEMLQKKLGVDLTGLEKKNAVQANSTSKKEPPAQSAQRTPGDGEKAGALPKRGGQGVSQSEKEALGVQVDKPGKEHKAAQSKAPIIDKKEAADEDEAGETPAKKKFDLKAMFTTAKEAVADFVFLTFKNKAHLSILIAGAVVSAAVAILLSFLFLGGNKAKLVKEEAAQQQQVITIEGGLRTEDDLFRLIWELYAQGYYKMSYDYAEQFVEKYPMSEMLGDVYYKMGDILYDWSRESKSLQYKKARLAYEKAIEIFPENNKVPWALYQIGNTYFMLKVYDEADKVYRKVIETFPTFRELDRVRNRLALTYLLLSDYERARMEYKELIDTFPQSVFINNAYLRIAESYYRQNDYANAIKNYLSYIDRYPESPRLKEVNFRIAKLSEVRRNYEAAIMYYKRSIGTYPYDTYNQQAKFHIAECWYLSGDYKRAREVYSNIADEYPDTKVAGLAVHRIGDSYFKEGLMDKARESYEFALERQPGVPIAKRSAIKLGEVYFKNEEYDKVIDTYQELVDGDPNYFGNDRLVLRIGQAHFNKGDYLDAADWFLRLIKEYPTSDLIRKAYFGKAKAEESAQYFEEAIKSYEDFMAQYPDHPKGDFIMFQIGLMQANIKKYDEALDTFERLRERFIVSDFRYSALIEIGKIYLSIAASDTLLKERAKQSPEPLPPEELKKELLVMAEEAFFKVFQNKALEGREDHFTASLELARFYNDQEMYGVALDVLDKALAVYRGERRAYRLLELKGYATYKLNRTEETVTTYEDLITLLSEAIQDKTLDEEESAQYKLIIAESYIALGDMLYAEDKFSEALYIYLESIKAMPLEQKRPWPFYQIANCYNRLNNYEKANFYYEKVKKEFPDSFWDEHIGWNQERMNWERSFKQSK
jgi:TolA-binding protein